MIIEFSLEGKPPIIHFERLFNILNSLDRLSSIPKEAEDYIDNVTAGRAVLEDEKSFIMEKDGFVTTFTYWKKGKISLTSKRRK